MIKKIGMFLSITVCLSLANLVHAEDEPIADQIKTLKSDIQSQLDEVKKAQANQSSNFNKQVQEQIKQTKTLLYKDMKKSAAKTKTDVKTFQKNVEADIKKLKQLVKKM
jgi:hypothetical protein